MCKFIRWIYGVNLRLIPTGLMTVIGLRKELLGRDAEGAADEEEETDGDEGSGDGDEGSGEQDSQSSEEEEEEEEEEGVTVAYLIRCVDAGERAVEGETRELLHYEKAALRVVLGFMRRLVKHQRKGLRRLCNDKQFVKDLFESLNRAQKLDRKEEAARKREPARKRRRKRYGGTRTEEEEGEEGEEEEEEGDEEGGEDEEGEGEGDEEEEEDKEGEEGEGEAESGDDDRAAGLPVVTPPLTGSLAKRKKNTLGPGKAWKRNKRNTRGHACMT